ncbi:MAG: sugar ABC transporter ATP-binding protein [Ruminococcaceae bacterium]|nr:sugar ABC transporter ATP-binding protein [Oscillospiraceae bacterium]
MNHFRKRGSAVGSAILTMRNISKNFPGVKALDQVDFTLRAGEIHALMGENGAGKSTLIKVLTGVEELETGEIRVEGIPHPIVNRSPQEAQANGISTVYQEVNLCPNLSVAENIFIGREPRKLGAIHWKEINRRAKTVMENLNIHIDVTKALENYSVAIQQMVAIARAVDISAKVLILDEPTSSLDEQEVQKLFRVMNQLKERGIGIIFVTHFLEQMYEISDRVTVLRNGGLVGEYEVESLPRVQLVAKMMGKEFDDLASIKNESSSQKDHSGEEPVVSARGLGHAGTIKPFDLDIYQGEVIGLTGLLGSGRSELARAIYGADKADCGVLHVKGKKVQIHAPIDAMKAGMGFLPENRKEEGVIADLSVRENIIIALQAKRGMFRLLTQREQEKITDEYIKMLQIKTAGRETPVKQLSGGNQQKVILGRWLLTHPDFLILDEPTRGIDVGTKTEIQKLVLKLAGEGMAIMFISSEIEEMLRTVSRMGVLRDGAKVGELEEIQLTQTEVMAAIAGGGNGE